MGLFVNFVQIVGNVLAIQAQTGDEDRVVFPVMSADYFFNASKFL